MIRQPLLHRRGGPQRLMNPAEVIEGEPQRVRGFEPISQPCHATHSHPNTQVLALYVTGANPVPVGVPAHDHRDRIDNLSRGIPLLPLSARAIHFGERYVKLSITHNLNSDHDTQFDIC